MQYYCDISCFQTRRPISRVHIIMQRVGKTVITLMAFAALDDNPNRG